MSVRGELVRLGLRAFVKRVYPTVEAARASLRLAQALVPAPPAGTRVSRLDAFGVPADRVATPVSLPDRHVLYLHGGGYVSGSPALYRSFTWRIAAAARAQVLVPDYRLAPEHPFPAALDDAVAACRWLFARGADPRRTAVIGDSAGGGLALALLLKLRDDGLDRPAAAVVLSPWTDLALTGASIAGCRRRDPMQTVANTHLFAASYLAGADPRNPHASPLYGDPAGLPPTLVHVGSDEILNDDAVRMADRMRAAGCEVRLQVWPRMPHVWHLFAPVLPEANAAIRGIAAFTEVTLAGGPQPG